MNQPELETLGYKPGDIHQKFPSTSFPLKTCGKLTFDIKPEMRVNKTEDANEHPAKANIEIITEIEGLISKVNERMGDLYEEQIGLSNSPNTKKVAQALEEIDLFQKTTLFELRKAFE